MRKIFSRITTVTLILILLSFYGCTSEPEKPTIMETLVGKYESHFSVVTKDNVIIGDLKMEDSTSTHQLTLNADYTFTLFIKGTHPTLDSIIIIDQAGTFEIKWSYYEDNSSCILCTTSYEGNLIFNPEQAKSWGGRFSYYDYYDNLDIGNLRKIITDDGVEIIYYTWEKVESK